MRARWPKAKYVEDFAATAPTARAHLRSALWRQDQPLRVVLIGTDFEVRVWEKLLDIPMGKLTTYSDLAAQGRRAESRARGRRRGRQEPDLLRGAVPSRHRQERRAHRLSLGPHAQARDARLGSRHGGGVAGTSSSEHRRSFEQTEPWITSRAPERIRDMRTSRCRMSEMRQRRHMMRIRYLLALLAATALAPSAAFAQANDGRRRRRRRGRRRRGWRTGWRRRRRRRRRHRRRGDRTAGWRGDLRRSASDVPSVTVQRARRGRRAAAARPSICAQRSAARRVCATRS